MRAKAAVRRLACAAFVAMLAPGAPPARACVPPIAYLHFAPGAAAVSDSHRSILEGLVLAPSRELRNGRNHFAIVGHADSVGTDDDNLDLSRRRAEAVRAYLLSVGVPAAAIRLEYYGERRPFIVASGAEQANRVVWVEFSNPAYPLRCP